MDTVLIEEEHQQDEAELCKHDMLIRDCAWCRDPQQ